MEINLHGYELAEAQIEVDYALRECIIQGDSELRIIHGYHGGTILKNYFRSSKFLETLKRQGISVKRAPSLTPGDTTYRILKG